MDEKAQARKVAELKRRRILLLVKILASLIIATNLGFLIYYLAKHPFHIRIGGRSRLLAAEPGELDFGQAEGGMPISRKITIRNRTRREVDIQYIDFTNGSFHLESNCNNVVLGSREELELTVIYEPYLGGTSTGEMQVRLRGQSTPDLTVPVRGEALLPRLELSPPSLAFGEVETRAGARLPLTLRNIGTSPLQVTGIAVRGQGFGLAKPFAGVTINPEGALSVEVLFVPARLGENAGELRITSSDPNNPALTIGLSGSYGIAAKKERDKAQALALLNEAKAELNNAYAYLSFRSTNKSLMRDRHQIGKNILDRAWPKYEHANRVLRGLDPALEDKTFSIDDQGALQRH